MSRPALALIALILVAFALVAITSRGQHPDLPPAEKEAQEERQKQEELTQQQKAQQEKAAAAAADPNRQNAFDAVKTGAVHARLEIEDRGGMTLELYPQVAPETVAHFTDLIKRNFYAGILAHRVVAGFVAQMGDPESKKLKSEDLRGLSAEEVGSKFRLGGGGSGTTVPLEANLPHLKYSVGLARSQAEDSGDSQFYINLNDNGAALDGKYCVFGRIVEGQKVADTIKIGDRIKSFTLIP